jgi:hypothetical protein
MTIRATTDAVLGYLVCGFLMLAACEAAYDGNWLFERDWQPEAIVIFGTIALCGGWFVSRVSRELLERQFVRGCLQAPEEILFAESLHGDRSWKRTLFPGYFRPLPDETRDWILETAERDGLNEPGAALFRHALSVVHQQPAMRRRIELSRQLSDICRSLCVGCVAVSVILITGIIWHGLYSSWGQSDLRKLGYCLLSLWEALGLLYRYLKYQRQYTLHVLTGYAELREPD